MNRLYALATVFLLNILYVSCSNENCPARTDHVIGTVCTVNAFEGGSEKLYDEVFTRLAEIDARFSTTRADSDISRTNAQAGKQPVSVHDDVFFVVKKAVDVARESKGVFDPTIGPLVKLWGIQTDAPHVPTEAELAAVLPLVDYTKLTLNESDNSLFLETAGMALELGGIAKGFAADEVARILHKHHVKRAIIDLGGNIVVYGKKRNAEAWAVGVKNPLLEHERFGTPCLAVKVKGNKNSGVSVVTSGTYERYFERDGIRYHHILDITSGAPAVRPYSSATIVSEASSLEADALSTAAFLLGPEQFSAAFPEVQAFFIQNDGTLFIRKGLKGSIETIDDYFRKAVFY